MADPVFVAGKIGYVIVDGTDFTQEYPMGEWQFPMHAEFIKRNTFRSEGFQNGVSGFKSSKFTIRGPYAYALSPLSVGETYTFRLGIDATGPYEFTVVGHVTDITPSNSSEGAPEIEVSCDSIGSFDFTTV